MSAPLLARDQSLGSISARVSDIPLTRRFGRVWRWGIAVAVALTLLLACGIVTLLYKGVGIWGINMPVAWAFAIANYVWWIGIGMGGTFISGALYLAGKDWRNSINRYAEAMTVFAVSVSGIFPILHLGRPWFFLLAISLSGHHERVAPMAQFLGVGFLRHSRLSFGVDPVLLRGHDPGFGHNAGPRPDLTQSAFLRLSGPGLAGRGAPMAAVSNLKLAAGGSRRTAGVFRAQHGGVGFLRGRACRAGTRASFRRSSWPAHCSPDLPWCWSLAFPCAERLACRRTSPAVIWTISPK